MHFKLLHEQADEWQTMMEEASEEDEDDLSPPLEDEEDGDG